MTLRLDPATIVFGEFGCLEPADPAWLAEKDYWEDYNARFFRSNGLDYGPADSRVDRWLTAPDRAPFSGMAEALLATLSERADLSGIDFVLLAHWLPDLHLGTSVTNFALHRLGCADGFGFAISDRGRSAPLFALHCIARYLERDRKRALLLVMDQKHLLYRSAAVEALEPTNSAAAMVLERDGPRGFAYGGYERAPDVPAEGLCEALDRACRACGAPPDRVTLVADPAVLAHARHPGPTLEQEPRHLCAAPFAALAAAEAPGDGVVVAGWEDGCLTTVRLRRDGGEP